MSLAPVWEVVEDEVAKAVGFPRSCLLYPRSAALRPLPGVSCCKPFEKAAAEPKLKPLENTA